MKRSLAALLLLLASCATPPTSGPPSDLIACGGDEVFILGLPASGVPEKIWSWRASEHPELPEALRKKFGSTDECKPVDEGRKILITSSGGAVALVERPSGKVLFHAAVVNAHSAEPLPGNRVVVASSYGEGGNRLVLFDLAVSDKPLATEDLHGAHGAVWDADRNLLWVLGETELRAYQLKSETFVPKVVRSLPNAGGHDLRPVPGSPALLLTTGQHVWVFDRDLLAFRTHPRIGDLANVKCVDLDPESGALAYVQGEKSWWAERVKFLGLDRTVEFPGLKLYKARWTPRSE
jgi:hypothetical protein